MSIPINEKKEQKITLDQLEDTLLSLIKQNLPPKKSKKNFGLFGSGYRRSKIKIDRSANSKEFDYLFVLPSTNPARPESYQLPFKVHIDESGDIDIFCCDLDPRSANAQFKKIVEAVLRRRYSEGDSSKHFHDYFHIIVKPKLFLATQEEGGPLAAEFKKLTIPEAFEKLNEMSREFDQKKQKERRPAGPA